MNGAHIEPWEGIGDRPDPMKLTHAVGMKPTPDPHIFEIVRAPGPDTSLHQAEWWKTREGEYVRLVDMTPTHRANLLALLLRNAKRYIVSAAWEASGYEGGDHAMDAAEAYANELLDLEHDGGREAQEEWMRHYPLVARLTELVAADEASAAELRKDVPGTPGLDWFDE